MELTTESLERWRRAIRDDVNGRYLLSMAVAIRFQGGGALALPWLEKAHREAGSHQDAAAFALSQALSEVGEEARAIRISHDAVARNPDHELAALRDLGAFYLDTPVVPEPARTDLLTRAFRMARERGNLAVTGETGARLAVQHARLGRFDDARDVLQALDGLTAATPETVALLLELLATATDEHDLWCAAARALIILMPAGASEEIPTLHRVASKADTMDQPAIMVMALERILAIAPRDVPARLRLAQNRAIEGDEAAAVALLMEMVSGGDVATLVALSNILFLAGRTEEADRYSAENLDRHPDAIAAIQQRGLLLIAMGRHQEAVTLLRPVTDMWPSNPSLGSTLALALHHLGDSEDALKHMPLPQSVSTAGGSWVPWYLCVRGVIQDAVGRSDDATRSFTEAARIATPGKLRFHLRLRPTIADAAMQRLQGMGFAI